MIEYRVINKDGVCEDYTPDATAEDAVDNLHYLDKNLRGAAPHRLQSREVGPWVDVDASPRDEREYPGWQREIAILGGDPSL